MDTNPPHTNAIVELSGIGHSFGATEALKNLDMSVPEGRITVLLGPNGAGKTTTARVVTGALTADSGRVRTFGRDPVTEGHLVRPHCGVVSAKPALYDRLSGRDNLDYSAELYGVKTDKERRIRDAAGRFGIDAALDDLVGGYSTGMKTRLALARSILHDPRLLLFDEPTSGLDPESSSAVLSYIRDMTTEGRTVVMCTHLLSEAEGLADHIVIMEGGTDLISGSPEVLTKRFWPHPVVTLNSSDQRLLERMRGWNGVVGMRNDPSGARIELDDIDRVPDLVAALVADGIPITRVEPHTPTLEDLYFLIRRKLGERARADGLEVADPLDPVSNTTLAPSHGMGPGSRSADHMPVIEVPDGLPPMTERPHETDLHETDLRETR
ncbi:MAG: ABC transporter ATP-binding protein [Microthrixaceae bacterium]|nr:ABC transporter ATP-binding protein [Microthrixaceae bacterium]MCB9386468.1 ABC transporter ATP-binding protein [Microthrixaceae bacterium]MCO5320161.1 ABC transporter ATP-binding protein [Microthrixaceae bacterium]